MKKYRDFTFQELVIDVATGCVQREASLNLKEKKILWYKQCAYNRRE